MPASHNYAKDGPRALYSTDGRLKDGRPYVECYSDQDVNIARSQGFTSDRYVFSSWPKTVFNKETGRTKAVDSQAQLEQLGPEWTTEVVAEKVAPVVGAPLPELPANGVKAMLKEIQMLQADIEAQSKQSALMHSVIAEINLRTANIDHRLSMVEGVINDVTVESAGAPAAK